MTWPTQELQQIVAVDEIYASRDAYEAHIQSAHFQKYKTSTIEMVRSLRLVDMDAMDTETMTRIFTKLQPRNHCP